jgi:ArsR family metal-binding transcriptional regulator
MAHNTRREARRRRQPTPRSAKSVIDEIVRALRPKTRCYHCGERTTMNSYFDIVTGRVYPPICYSCYLGSDVEIEKTSCSLGECSEELLDAALQNPFVDPYAEIVWN